MRSLLAVDLGLKTGLALYGDTGRLCWYRSKNYGTAARLRRDINNLLNNLPDLFHIVLEGGGSLAKIWEHEAERREIAVRQITAETWRQKLLYPRERMKGLQAKHHANDLAKQVIIVSGLPRPTALRHDTAEAVLIGLWAVLDIGWLKKIPEVLRR
jgi:hypothetical protein